MSQELELARARAKAKLKLKQSRAPEQTENVQADPEKEKSDISLLETAGRSGGQGLTMGFQDEASAAIQPLVNKVGDFFTGNNVSEMDDSTYEQRRDEFRRLNKEAADANPKTALASEIAGGLVTTVAGGGALGKVAQGTGKVAQAADKALKLAKTGKGIVATGTAEGALAGAGYNEDPDRLMKDVALGAGVGAGMGLVGVGAGKVLNRGAKAVEGAGEAAGDFAEEVSDDFARRALGFERGTLNKIKGGAETANNYARLLKNEGLFQKGMSVDAMSSSVDDIVEASGKQIDEIYNSSTLGKSIASNVDELVEQIDDNVIKEIRDLGSYSAENKQLQTILEDINKFTDADGNLTYENLWKIRKFLGDKGFGQGATLENKQPFKQAFAQVADFIDNKIAQNAGEETSEALRKANATHHAAKKAREVLDIRINREAGNKLGGLTDYVFAGAGGAIGGVPGAVASVAGKKLYENFGLQAGAKVMSKVAKNLDHPAMKKLLGAPSQFVEKYGNVLMTAAARGPAAVAATHHMLKKNDPEYSNQFSEDQQNQAQTKPPQGGSIERYLDTDPTALGKYAKPLQDAKNRGGNALGVNMYILEKQDPNFNAMKKKLEAGDQ